MPAKYSLIIPAYNEEEVLNETYRRVSGVMQSLDGPYEIIFVNDGSRDKTWEMLRELAANDKAVKAISFSRNFGHQIAVSAGLDHASGDAVIIIDCDLQDPPEVIPEMVAKWKEGYDIVYGKRAKRKGESFFKKFTAFAYYRILKSLSGQKMQLDTGDFRLIDKRVRDTICAMPEKNRYLRGMFSWMGFKQIGVEFTREPRFAGETKYTLKKMLKLAGDGITSFSYRPLKLPLGLGCVVTALSAVYFVLSIVLLATGVWSDFWHIPMSVMAGFMGLIMIMLGIMGVYLGRISDGVLNRPLYIVAEKLNLDQRVLIVDG